MCRVTGEGAAKQLCCRIFFREVGWMIFHGVHVLVLRHDICCRVRDVPKSKRVLLRMDAR